MFFEDLYLTNPRKTWWKVRQAIRLMSQFAPRPADFSARSVATLIKYFEKGRSPWSVKTMLQTIRAICTRLRRARVLAVNPFRLHGFIPRKLKRPRDRTDKHLSLEDTRRLLEAANDEVRAADSIWLSFAGVPRRNPKLDQAAELAWRRRFRAHKLRAYLAVLAYTGMRAGEAVWLKRRDVDFAAGVIEIGNNHRTKTPESEAPVGLPAELVPLLRAYLDVLDEYFPGGAWLFPKQTVDTPWDLESGKNEYRPTAMLVALGHRAGIEGSTSLSLRHSFVTNGKARLGLTREQVRIQLRHTNLETQEHYEHTDTGNLQAIASRISFGVVWPDGSAPKPAAM